MKTQLMHDYGLEVIGVIKVNEHVYKLKTFNRIYYMKIVKNQSIDKIYEWIEVLHLNIFVDVLKNKQGTRATPYQSKYYYIMEAVHNNQGMMKEVKIKFYFETLASLHTKSFYYTKVNQDYFMKLQKDICDVIQERELYYTQMIQNYETIVYRSPSQWLLIMNYYRIYNALCMAKQYLNQYMMMTQDCTQIRVCLTYKHFDYNHIALKEKVFLSLDHICIDMPLYDIFDMYQKVPDILFDLDCLSQYYFKKIELTQEEKVLLCCLMNIVPMIYYSDDEIENIIKLSRLLYYLDSIQSLTNQLTC